MEGDPIVSAKAKMLLDILNNEIVEPEYKSNHIPPIVMEGYSKGEHYNKWRTCCERITQLGKQCGQSLSMIRGQCMQVILDKMKHDTYWDNTSESYNPLNLLKLIEKTILPQTEEQYCYKKCIIKSVHYMASNNTT